MTRFDLSVISSSQQIDLAALHPDPGAVPTIRVLNGAADPKRGLVFVHVGVPLPMQPVAVFGGGEVGTGAEEALATAGLHERRSAAAQALRTAYL